MLALNETYAGRFEIFHHFIFPIPFLTYTGNVEAIVQTDFCLLSFLRTSFFFSCNIRPMLFYHIVVKMQVRHTVRAFFFYCIFYLFKT